jgi:hypothetical protein
MCDLQALPPLLERSKDLRQRVQEICCLSIELRSHTQIQQKCDTIGPTSADVIFSCALFFRVSANRDQERIPVPVTNFYSDWLDTGC